MPDKDEVGSSSLPGPTGFPQRLVDIRQLAMEPSAGIRTLLYPSEMGTFGGTFAPGLLVVVIDVVPLVRSSTFGGRCQPTQNRSPLSCATRRSLVRPRRFLTQPVSCATPLCSS